MDIFTVLFAVAALSFLIFFCAWIFAMKAEYARRKDFTSRHSLELGQMVWYLFGALLLFIASPIYWLPAQLNANFFLVYLFFGLCCAFSNTVRAPLRFLSSATHRLISKWFLSEREFLVYSVSSRVNDLPDEDRKRVCDELERCENLPDGVLVSCGEMMDAVFNRGNVKLVADCGLRGDVLHSLRCLHKEDYDETLRRRVEALEIGSAKERS